MSETPDFSTEPAYPDEPTWLSPAFSATFLPETAEVELVFMDMNMDPMSSGAKFQVKIKLSIDEFISL